MSIFLNRKEYDRKKYPKDNFRSVVRKEWLKKSGLDEKKKKKNMDVPNAIWRTPEASSRGYWCKGRWLEKWSYIWTLVWIHWSVKCDGKKWAVERVMSTLTWRGWNWESAEALARRLAGKVVTALRTTREPNVSLIPLSTVNGRKK